MVKFIYIGILICKVNCFNRYKIMPLNHRHLDYHLLNFIFSFLPGLLLQSSPYANFEQHERIQERAILAPTHDNVDIINDYLLSLMPGEEKIYLSSDSICKTDSNMGLEDVFPPEFLNTIKCFGIPNHLIKLKVGVPVMLLRNIDQANGLCNGTILVITELGNHVIGAKKISGGQVGDKVFIPRMTLSPSDTTTLPISIQRRQFPLVVCFAMTINKSQGQSLSHVGLYLPRSVFSHGQLYVAISRVTRKEGLKILICDDDGQITNTTKNVVYKEVFENLP